MDIAIALKDPLRKLELSGILERWQLEEVIEVLGYGRTIQEVLSKVEAKKPEVIISDLEGVNSKHLKIIRDNLPGVKILIYSETIDIDNYLAEIDGYCHPKTGQLLTALNVISSGAIYWDSPLKESLSEKMRTIVNPNLTLRQKEVLEYLIKGLSNQEIAEKLEVSINTIKNHVQNIMGKLMVTNRTEMAVKAMRYGLLDPEKEVIGEC